jgi:hypothetical protein
MITNLQIRRILHAFTIMYILVGFLYFYYQADFVTNEYHDSKTYYIFDKGMAGLLVLCICFPCFEFKKEWFTLGLFFVCRLMWEWLAINDYVAANRPSIIFILFIIDVLCIITLFILRITKTKR